MKRENHRARTLVFAGEAQLYDGFPTLELREPEQKVSVFPGESRTTQIKLTKPNIGTTTKESTTKKTAL
jgi:hypothetical protein